MKKWMGVAVAAVLLFAVPSIARAEDHSWKWFGTLRARPEFDNNLSDVNSFRDDQIFFTSYRANVGFSADLDHDVTVLIDGQVIGKWGEDSPFRGEITTDSTAEKFGVYRGYVEARKIGGSPVTVRAGRQPLQYGDEWILGDEEFYGGTSWDGVRANIETENGWWNESLFWARSVETTSPEQVPFGNGDTSGTKDLFGYWGGWSIADNQKLDFTVLYDHDRLESSLMERRWTYAGHYSYGGDEGVFVNLDLGAQSGRELVSSYATDHRTIRAEAGELTGGWVCKEHDRFWGRIASYSGDDPSTNKNETWDPIAMDFHNRYGALDFWNGTYGHGAYIGGPSGFQVAQVGADLNLPWDLMLKLTAQQNRRDKKISGEFKNKDLGWEWGVALSRNYGKNLNLELGLGRLHAGRAFKGEATDASGRPDGPQSDASRAYLQAVVHF
jgi:hypothetical protein